MSGYYPGIDRPPRRRGDERRDPYTRRTDRAREDIPWRGGRYEDEGERGGYDRDRERDRERDRDRDTRYRSRSRNRQPPSRYPRYSRDASRDRRSSPPASRYRDEGPSSDARRRSRSRDSLQRREDDGRYSAGGFRRSSVSRASSRPISGSQRDASEPLDYSSEEGMVSPPVRRAQPSRAPRSPARRDRQSSRSSSTSERPRYAEKRERVSPAQETPLSKRARLPEATAREDGPNIARPAAPPTGPAATRAPINPYAKRPPVTGTNATAPTSRPFAPPSGPRSERFGTDRFGNKEPPRGPAAERYGTPRSADAGWRVQQPVPSVSEPGSVVAAKDREDPATTPSAPTQGRLEPPRPETAPDRIARPTTPASSSHRSPGTPASGVDSLDRRPTSTPGVAKPSAPAHLAGEAGPSAGSNPYAGTPSRPPAPATQPASANKRPEKVPYDREWKRYKTPVEPVILDRSTLDGIAREQAVDESKTKFVTVRSREISKYSEWEGELAKANYERAKKVHAFQTLAHEARLARYDLERAEDELLAADRRIEYARSYQAHALDFDGLSASVRMSPKRAAAA